MFNNSRAAEAFTGQLFDIGKIASIAFPVTGGLAFVGMLADVGSTARN
jgi:hypothetical protein